MKLEISQKVFGNLKNLRANNEDIKYKSMMPQITKNIKGTFKVILTLISRYVLNIMKKIEFELIRNEGVYVKLTEEQKLIVRKLAKCQKKSTSDFMKWLIFSKYIDDFIK